MNEINNRQTNRLVKNSLALAAYTDLSTQEMNDLRDLTSRFAIQIKSALDHLVQVKWPMPGPLQHGWRADAGLDGGDEVFQFVLHRHFGAVDSFAFCWTSIYDLERPRRSKRDMNRRPENNGGGGSSQSSISI